MTKNPGGEARAFQFLRRGVSAANEHVATPQLEIPGHDTDGAIERSGVIRRCKLVGQDTTMRRALLKPISHVALATPHRSARSTKPHDQHGPGRGFRQSAGQSSGKTDRGTSVRRHRPRRHVDWSRRPQRFEKTNQNRGFSADYSRLSGTGGDDECGSDRHGEEFQFNNPKLMRRSGLRQAARADALVHSIWKDTQQSHALKEPKTPDRRILRGRFV